MTDFRLKRLEKYKTGGTDNRPEYQMPLPKTPSGKVYRCCPNDECQPGLFLLGSSQEDIEIDKSKIKREPGSPLTSCPYCGEDAEDDKFNYDGDVEAITKYVEWAAQREINDYLERFAKKINRGQKANNFFSLKMSVNPDRTPEPKAWREDLIRNLACNICGREYGVYAIALYCPDCAGKNFSIHFGREIEIIKEQIDIAEQVAETGNLELSYRILGNAHEDVVTAFETYQKVFYKHIVTKLHGKGGATEQTRKKKIGNSFQNIEKAKKLFKSISMAPYETFTESELRSLVLNLEKRHIIGHNLSMIDEAYSDGQEVNKSGTTIEILAGEITEFADVCQKLIIEFEKYL